MEPIFTFPDKALEPLAERLPALDVVRLARVSRAWRDQLGRTVLTECVGVGIHGPEWRRASAVAWLSKNLHRTRDLIIAGGLLADSLLAASAADGLERLELEGGPWEMLPKCTALRELRFSDSDVTELPPLDALTRLTRLSVADCGRIEHLPPLSSCTALRELCFVDAVQLASLPSLAGCTSLEALHVIQNQETTYIYDSLELPEDLQTLTALTSLVLHGCRGDTLPKLDGFLRLKTLDIAYCDVNASQLLRLTALTSLSDLRVAKCCAREEQDGAGFFLAGAQLPPLTALPALRSVCLEDYNGEAGGERFPSLAGLTRLTRLTVTRCRGIQPAQLLALLPGLTALVELTIVDGPHGLDQLPSLSSCVQLQRLTIRSCWELTALQDLSGCTRLEELCCLGCPKLKQLPSLESLGQLQYLLIQECDELRALPDLSGCTRLKDLSSGGQSLKELPDLGACLALKTVKFLPCTWLFETSSFQQWKEELEKRGVLVISFPLQQYYVIDYSWQYGTVV